MKPRMSRREIRLIERALLRAGKDGRTVQVLEWGSGGSTVYFTQYMRAHNIPYRWESVEYNKKWLGKVNEALEGDAHTHIAFFNVGNDALKQRDIPMDKYVEYPRTLDTAFDVVIVDGRKRRRCLLEAQKILKEDGYVFLHDAQRKYYHSAFTTYRNHSFISWELWRGNNKEVDQMGEMQNTLRSLFYTLLFKLFVYPVRKTGQHIAAKYNLTRDTLKLLSGAGDKLKVLYALLVVRLPLFRGSFYVQVDGQPFRVSSSEYTNGLALYNVLKRAHDIS